MAVCRKIFPRVITYIVRLRRFQQPWILFNSCASTIQNLIAEKFCPAHRLSGLGVNGPLTLSTFGRIIHSANTLIVRPSRCPHYFSKLERGLPRFLGVV